MPALKKQMPRFPEPVRAVKSGMLGGISEEIAEMKKKEGRNGKAGTSMLRGGKSEIVEMGVVRRKS